MFGKKYPISDAFSEVVLVSVAWDVEDPEAPGVAEECRSGRCRDSQFSKNSVIICISSWRISGSTREAPWVSGTSSGADIVADSGSWASCDSETPVDSLRAIVGGFG